MINLEVLASNFDEISRRLRFRGVKEDFLLEIKKLFNERNSKIEIINKIRNERNQLKDQKIERNLKSINLKKEIKETEFYLKQIVDELQKLCEQLPNVPHINTPNNESGNRLVKTVFHELKNENSLNYEKVLKKVKIIDKERSPKIVGSKFVVYEGLGVKILQSLISFMLSENQKFGYKLISAPYLTSLNNLYNTGQLPKFADDIFKIENHEFGLVPTSEVSLVNLYSDEIINEENLPIKVCSYSPCFRAEVGSAGQENKGLIRLHQFNKVELVNIVKPENSYYHLEELLKCASNILDKLEISYRIIELCYEELGFSSAKTYDIEVWLPNSKKWLEISSCTNCEDFQANRAKIRTKKNGKKITLHTLNGSSLAIDRLILAILEYWYDEKEDKLKIHPNLNKYFEIF